MAEKYRNGRMMIRRRSGKFAPTPTLQQMGFDVAKGERMCNGCGRIWRPILVSGKCPTCGTQDSQEWPTRND